MEVFHSRPWPEFSNGCDLTNDIRTKEGNIEKEANFKFVIPSCRRVFEDTKMKTVRTTLTALFLCLTILCGIVETASGAAAGFGQKTASGPPKLNPDIYTYKLGSLGSEPCSFDEIIHYDPATGVLYYVRQNPWSKFDPLGLEASWAHWHHEFGNPKSQGTRTVIEWAEAMKIDLKELNKPKHGRIVVDVDHTGKGAKANAGLHGTGPAGVQQTWDRTLDTWIRDFKENNGSWPTKEQVDRKIRGMWGSKRFRPIFDRSVPARVSYGDWSGMDSEQKVKFANKEFTKHYENNLREKQDEINELRKKHGRGSTLVKFGVLSGLMYIFNAHASAREAEEVEGLISDYKGHLKHGNTSELEVLSVELTVKVQNISQNEPAALKLWEEIDPRAE